MSFKQTQALAHALGGTKAVKVPIEFGLEVHRNMWGLGVGFWYAQKDADILGRRAYVFSVTLGPLHWALALPRKRWVSVRIDIGEGGAEQMAGVASSPKTLVGRGGHGGNGGNGAATIGGNGGGVQGTLGQSAAKTKAAAGPHTQPPLRNRP